MSMLSKKHVQQHNFWAISISQLITLSLMFFGGLFALGSYYNRFETLDRSFREYRQEVTERLNQYDRDLSILTDTNGQYLKLLQRNGVLRQSVQGVSTSSAKLKATPTPTLKPSNRTSTPRPSLSP